MNADIPIKFAPLIHIEGNSVCADCISSHSDWVSLGFATFICLDCAGKHRQLGTHITLVRSIKLDSFTQEQIDLLLHGGNNRFKNHLKKYNIINIDYTNPELLYYKEILQASFEGRDPISLEEFASQSGHRNSPSANNTKYAKVPISSPDWVPDDYATDCMICSRHFSFFTRKHHCRRCGICVCNKCAPKNNCRPILEWGLKEPVRHCKVCYKSPIIDWS